MKTIVIKLSAILIAILSTNLYAKSIASSQNYAGITEIENSDKVMSLSETLSKIHQREGIKSTIEQYHRLKKHYSDIYNFNEQALNHFGRSLLKNGDYQDAVKIFALNVKTFPNSSNAYSSLADSYIYNGNKVLAIQHYKKSLALNPTNMNALEMLNRLRQR